MLLRKNHYCFRVQRSALISLAAALSLLVLPAAGWGQPIENNQTKSAASATAGKGSGPLAGPRLVQGSSAPGVLRGFGTAAGKRQGAVGFRANLRLYRQVLDRLELPAKKTELIRAIYQRSSRETQEYFRGQAAEMQRLREIVKQHGGSVERPAQRGRQRDGTTKNRDNARRKTNEINEELEPEAAEALRRLREIYRQKPSAGPFMVELWALLDPAEQEAFQTALAEIRTADGAAMVKVESNNNKNKQSKRRGEYKSFLEVRLAFIDELLAVEGAGEAGGTGGLMPEDRRALERARLLIAAELADDSNDGSARSERRRGRQVLLPPPSAREIKIEAGG